MKGRAERVVGARFPPLLRSLRLRSAYENANLSAIVCIVPSSVDVEWNLPSRSKSGLTAAFHPESQWIIRPTDYPTKFNRYGDLG